MNFIEYQQREALNYTEEAIFPVPKALTFLKEKDIIEIDDEIYRVIKTITKQTITNTLNHILDSGLLEEMEHELQNDRGTKDGHNTLTKAIREFITNMK